MLLQWLTREWLVLEGPKRGVYWNLNEVTCITVQTLESNSAEYLHFVLLVVLHSVFKMSWKHFPDDWASPDVTVLILQYVNSLIFESVCLACTVGLVLRHLLPQAVSASVRREWYHSYFITFHFFLWEQRRMKPWVAVRGIHVVLSWGRAVRSLLCSAFQFTTKSYSWSSQEHSFPPGSKAVLSGKICPATWLRHRIQMELFHMTCWCQLQIWIFISWLFFNLRLPKSLINLGLIEHLIGFWSISSYWDFCYHSFRLV